MLGFCVLAALSKYIKLFFKNGKSLLIFSNLIDFKILKQLLKALSNNSKI
jgi:spore maturation protein CgeB